MKMGATSAVQYVFMIGQESTKGTAVTCDKDVGIVKDVSNNPTREIIESKSISDIKVVNNYEGNKEGAHSVTFEYQHGRIFSYIFGAPSHANSGTDYKHTFTVDNDPLTYTAQSGCNISTTDVGLQSTFCTVESAEISIEQNQILTIKVTSKSKFPTVLSTVPTHSTSTLTAFPSSKVGVYINSVRATNVQNFSIKVTKTLEVVHDLCSADPTDLEVVGIKVEFSGKLAFDASTYHTHFVSNNVTEVRLLADNGVAYGSGKRGMDLKLDTIVMGNMDEAASVGSVVFIDISGSAKFKSLDTYDNIAGASW